MSAIAIIVVNYNDYDSTSRLLSEIKEYSIINHIIIVDNCSTDNSMECLREWIDARIEVLELHSNLGYARGNNFGIKYAIEQYEAEYIIIANPDVLFDECIISKLISVLNRTDVKVGLATAKMESNQTYDKSGVWKQPTYGKVIFNNFMVLKKIFGDRLCYSKSYLQKSQCRVEVIAGSFFMSKASTMQDVNFFDENTFLYGEENILAMKLKRKGYINYLCNSVSYFHDHSASIDKNIDHVEKKFQWLHDSMMYYNQTYLHTNHIQDVIYEWSFRIGISNYIFIKRFLK